MPPNPEHAMTVRVRGVTYRNAKEAASALGISKNTIYLHLCRGTIDSAGLGPGRAPGSRHGGGCHAKPVRIGPHSFPSQGAVDRFLGKRLGYTSQVLRRRGKGRTKAYDTLVGLVMAKVAAEERRRALLVRRLQESEEVPERQISPAWG